MSKLGDVYGSISCEELEANCDVKSTEMGESGGFYGKYGPPAIVDSAVNRLRMLEKDSGISHRFLLTNDDVD